MPKRQNRTVGVPTAGGVKRIVKKALSGTKKGGVPLPPVPRSNALGSKPGASSVGSAISGRKRGVAENTLKKAAAGTTSGRGAGAVSAGRKEIGVKAVKPTKIAKPAAAVKKVVQAGKKAIIAKKTR